LIESLQAKHFNCRVIDTDHLAVRLYGDAAVVTGSARIQVVVSERILNVSLLFTNVWIREGDAWQMVAYQSTPRKPTE